MTSLADIESWVRVGESETLELKKTTGERREAAKTLCAMLNHRGGRVIFGVDPGGRLLGQMVSDRTVEEVAQEISEIEPPVFPSIERVPLTEALQLLVITAQPGSGQPYSYRGHAYRRVGNTSQRLSRQRNLITRAGLPAPEIEETNRCVTVRFRPTRYIPPTRVAQNVTDRQQLVLTVISSASSGLPLREIHVQIGGGLTERQLRKDLEALKILGLAQAQGHGRGARWILI